MRQGKYFTAKFTNGVSMNFFCPAGQDKMNFFKRECSRLGVEPFAVLVPYEGGTV